MDQSTDQWMTTREVADASRVSVATVARWARDGAVAHVKLPGGALRFRREDIDRLLTVEPAEQAS